MSAERFDGKFSAVQDGTGPEGNVARCCMTASRVSDRTHSITARGCDQLFGDTKPTSLTSWYWGETAGGIEPLSVLRVLLLFGLSFDRCGVLSLPELKFNCLCLHVETNPENVKMDQ